MSYENHDNWQREVQPWVHEKMALSNAAKVEAGRLIRPPEAQKRIAELDRLIWASKAKWGV